jgi:hypothetical protein
VHAADAPPYLKISPKNSFKASQERRSAEALYAAPFDLSFPAAGFVKL